ncbi:Ig-like domain-containing protein [Tropicimonas aquimaris]|uniref:Ig-like domain-containing protein n=1 Tax=Tropicimonas aquimaris TaxID=914152 RepID=A0ABW3IUH2_9RHOB
MGKPTRGSKGKDVLDTDTGTIQLAGGQGDDLYVVDDPAIKIVERRNGGTDTVETSVSFELQDWVENLSLSGAEAISGTGNDLANTLTGNDADNELYGLGGNDVLDGGDGNDLLDGGDGFDIAIYDRDFSDYLIEIGTDGIYVSSYVNGEIVATDILVDVEMLVFADREVLIAELLPSNPVPDDPAPLPVAEDDFVSLDEDTTISIDVLANDQGDQLSIAAVGSAQLGEVAIAADGTITYTPIPNANGTDSFEYTLTDAFGNSSTGTIHLEITPVNDAPQAIGDQFEVNGVGGFISPSSLLDNDLDPDGEPLSIATYDGTTANGGTVTIDENGVFSYQAPAAYDAGAPASQSDSFTYTVTDGHGGTSTATVSLTLIGEPDLNAPDVEHAPDYVLDALLAEGTGETSLRWNADQPLGTGTTIAYCFLDVVPGYYSASASEREGFEPFTEQQRSVALEALEQISSFTDITFAEVSDPSQAQLTFGNADLPGGAGWAYLPGNLSDISGDIWIDSTVSSNADLEPGGDGYMRIFHEIGHALGLKHPHESPALPDPEDTRQFTMMSYMEHAGTAGVEPSTYMVYDIAALQYLYGVGEDRSGDDTYLVNASNDDVMTIWDDGGHDTIDASSSVSGVTLNLEAGSFSTAGKAYGWYPLSDNIGIAYGTRIEDAFGGAGDDVLLGNDANNRLAGGQGNDSLTGGEGADIYAFGAGWGEDTISDFQDGLDMLDFTAAGCAFTDLEMTSTTRGVLLSLGDDTLLLAGITTDQIDQDDFWIDGTANDPLALLA